MADGPDQNNVGVAGRCGEAGVSAHLRLGRLLQKRCGRVLPAALAAIAPAVHLQDVHAVGEAVQQRPMSRSGPNTSVHSAASRALMRLDTFG